MLETLIQYQIYIIIGILVFPVFAFIIYFAKKMIDRAKFVSALHNMKKPLMERINNMETIYEMQEEQQEISTIIDSIRSDIEKLRKEIQASQDMLETEKIDQIEKDISAFYDNRGGHMPEEKKPEDTVIVQETPQEIYHRAVIQQQAYQLQVKQEQSALHKEQLRVMNQNISKFLVVYREKDRVIEERNRSIAEKNQSIRILQQKLNEAEQKLKIYIAEHQNDKNKDKVIEEKTRNIAVLQQRIQEMENKFNKIALLHKSITEKEEIKDKIIEEKNTFIVNLQSRLQDIEKKLQLAVTAKEESKENLLNRKLIDIDKRIQSETKKNRVLIILFIICLALAIGGFAFVYTHYLANISAYAI